MSNIIGSRFKITAIAPVWHETKRPCGMNNIVYMDNKYPSRKMIDNIKSRLKDDECCIIFDANDKAQYIYRAYGF